MDNALWNSSKGPLENLFHLVEMGAMVFAPTPLKFVTLFSSAFNLGLAELGASLDEAAGLTTLEDIKTLTPEDAATKVTTTLFDVTEDALAKGAYLYSQDLKRYAALEQELSSYVPLALTKEAKLGLLKGMIGKLKSKGGPGFIGLFFNRILGLFRWAWTWFKRILVGGLGILALKGTDKLHEHGGGAAKIRGKDQESGFKPDPSKGLIDISIKETPNPYKARLQEEIEEAMKL